MRKSGYLLAACFLLALGGAASAQMAPPLEPRSDRKDMSGPERKTVGWFFNRPSKSSAAEQFAYAGELLKDGKKKAAASAYNALVCAWRESPEAAGAQLKYALLLEESGDYAAAFDEYQYLIHYYAGIFDYSDVLQRQFKIANVIRTEKHSFLYIFPEYTSPEKALPLFEKIVRNGPSWTGAPEAQFSIGLIHQEQDEYHEAISAYDAVQNKYPDNPFAAEASFRRAYCFYKLAMKTPRNEVCARDAMSALASFVSAHRDSPNVEKAKEYFTELKNMLADKYFNQAVFYDNGAFSPKAALVAYSDFARKFPGYKRSDFVEKRIGALKEEMEHGKQ